MAHKMVKASPSAKSPLSKMADVFNKADSYTLSVLKKIVQAQNRLARAKHLLSDQHWCELASQHEDIVNCNEDERTARAWLEDHLHNLQELKRLVSSMESAAKAAYRFNTSHDYKATMLVD